MKKEIWKDVMDYEGIYKISNYGRIKSLARLKLTNGGVYYMTKEKIMTPIIKSIGYVQATFSKNNKQKIVLVHRIVAKHFLPKPTGGRFQINHKDGVGTNNHVDNLEWCTPSENGLHAYRILGIKNWCEGLFSKNHPTAKPIIQKTLSGEIVRVWDCAMDAVREVGADSGGITHCCKGEIKNHLGFIWEYKK